MAAGGGEDKKRVRFAGDASEAPTGRERPTAGGEGSIFPAGGQSRAEERSGFVFNDRVVESKPPPGAGKGSPRPLTP